MRAFGSAVGDFESRAGEQLPLNREIPLLRVWIGMAGNGRFNSLADDEASIGRIASRRLKQPGWERIAQRVGSCDAAVQARHVVGLGCVGRRSPRGVVKDDV